MYFHLPSHISFFFHYPAPTQIYTLSLHDALPISVGIEILLIPEPVRIDQPKDIAVKVDRLLVAEQERLAWCDGIAGDDDRLIRQRQKFGAGFVGNDNRPGEKGKNRFLPDTPDLARPAG